MDRVSISEIEDLRRYGVSVNTLHQIDVSAAVMNRIHTINSHHKQPSSILTVFNSQRRAAIITSAFIILEIVTIHDQEVIYMDARSATTSNTYFANKIGWYNEQAGVVYSIEDGADSPLSKEDIMRIAEGIIIAQ